jgi:hypothetical protein
VVAHFAVAVAHGAAHVLRAVFPEQAFDLAVILLAVYGGPVIALTLLNTRRGAASLLLLLSMGAALIYGAANHFVISGLDNVHGAGGGPVGIAFSATALVLLILEAEGAAVGALLLKDAWATRSPEKP